MYRISSINILTKMVRLENPENVIVVPLAAIENISYLSVIACFVAFFINDAYTFINWKKMQRNQRG